MVHFTDWIFFDRLFRIVIAVRSNSIIPFLFVLFHICLTSQDLKQRQETNNPTWMNIQCPSKFPGERNKVLKHLDHLSGLT